MKLEHSAMNEAEFTLFLLEHSLRALAQRLNRNQSLAWINP
jgi:hypothetical protein